MKGEQINFLMFDSKMNSIEFNTDSILQMHKKYHEHFDKYKEF